MYQLRTGPPVTVFSYHGLRLSASSDVEVLCLITLSTSFSHFISGCPHRRLLSGDQAIIRLGHLFSSIRTTCPYHFNILFSILSKIVCVTRIFSLMTSFLTFSTLEIVAALLKNQFLYFTVFSLTCNQVSKFPNRNLKCFLSLCQILISLYSPKYIYPKVGNLLLLLLFFLHLTTQWR